MEKLQQISEHLKNKTAPGHVYTIPLAQSQQILQSLIAQEQKCIMLFTSDKNKDGKDWCPYCVNVKPYYTQIHQEIAKLNLPFYVFIVGDQPTWKDQNHPFRKMKELKISSVPTFGYFNGKRLMGKLGGEEMVQEDMRKVVYDSVKEDQ